MATGDIVIKGGTVVDGTGAPGRAADVLVRGERIAAIGHNLDVDGARVLDATGKVVAPGFIDIHTHYDGQVFWDPALSPSCFHGVTTVVAGNCGFSIAPCRPGDHALMAATLEKVEDMNPATLAAGIPWDFETFPEYLDSVRRRGSVLNFGAYIGHTALRMYVMGPDASNRAPTAAELDQMKSIIIEAMDAGAIGIATSFAVTHVGADGRPIPSRVADADEFDALVGAMASTGRGVVNLALGTNLPMAQLYELQRKHGRPFTYTALLTNPSGRHLELAAMNERERANGAEVWPQVTCRPLVFSQTMIEPFTLNATAPFQALMPKTLEDRKAAYADAEWRAEAYAQINELKFKPRFDVTYISESETHPELIDRSVVELADEWGCTPLDVLCKVALDDNLQTRLRTALANDDVEGVAFLLAQDHCTLGLSDAGAHVGQLCDAPQATDLLGNWVRGKGLLSVETAVRKLSGQQADIYGLTDRGYLREGAYADITVFDLDTVAPGPIRRVRDFPANADRLTADQPTGITHVLVNGTPICTDGKSLVGAVGTVAADSASRPGHLIGA